MIAHPHFGACYSRQLHSTCMQCSVFLAVLKWLKSSKAEKCYQIQWNLWTPLELRNAVLHFVESGLQR
jgi:hypothetical protein